MLFELRGHHGKQASMPRLGEELWKQKKKTANTKALKGAEFNMGLREGEEG